MSDQARLTTLRDAGAEAFDGPGFRFVEGLLSRAAGLGGQASEMLRRRAHARLTRLEQEFSEAKADAERLVAQVIKSGADPADLRARLRAGDFRAVQRRAPAALREANNERDVYASRALRLAGEAASRGLPLEQADRARVLAIESGDEAPSVDRALGDRLAQALFRDTAAQARGVLVLARAAATVPVEAGPYNPQALAVQALELAESLSPAYLRAYLRDLEALSVLHGLPALPRRRRRR